MGRLKISLRTQSDSLIGMIGGFFALWIGIEGKYLRKLFPKGNPWSGGGASFTREFLSPNGPALSDEQLAEAIGGYINLLDGCLRLYFEDKTSAERIEERYKAYLSEGVLVI